MFADALPEGAEGLFISTGSSDFVIVGRSMNVYFASATDPSVNIGLGTVEESRYMKGTWVPGRRLNGDETPEWKALRFRDEYGIQRVTLYNYR